MEDRLRPDMTRAEGLAHLESVQRRVAGNGALDAHVRKVRAMTDDEWMAHLARLMTPDPDRIAAIRRMAAELLSLPR